MYSVRSSSLWCVTNGRPRRAAVDRLQDRRLDLDEPLGIEEAPHLGDHARARHEQLARLLVGHQVELALAVARLDVGQPVVLLGRRPQRLRQQRPRVDRRARAHPAGYGRRFLRRRADRRGPARRAGPATPGPSTSRAGVQLQTARSDRRDRGTQPCPGRGERPTDRPPALATSVSSPAGSSSHGSLTEAIGTTPANECGNGSTPSSRSAASLRRRWSTSSSLTPWRRRSW